MSSYRSAVRDQRIADDFTKTQAACTHCARLADVEALNTYGARCFDCYCSFCAQGRHYQSLSWEDRKAMAQRVRDALAGGLRAPPREHMAHLAALESAGKATIGQRWFLAASRRPMAGVGADQVAARKPVEQAHSPQPEDATEPPSWATE